MYATRSSSFNVSWGVADGDSVETETHDIDVALGPVEAEGSGAGAVGVAEAFAVGDDTYAVGTGDVSVDNGSIDAAIGTYAYAEGHPDEFVYASTIAELDSHGGGMSGLSISYEHTSYSATADHAVSTSLSTRSVTTVNPGASSGASEDPAPEPLEIDVEGIEGNAAAYLVEVFAAGSDSFAYLDLSAFALDSFSSVNFVAIAEIA